MSFRTSSRYPPCSSFTFHPSREQLGCHVSFAAELAELAGAPQNRPRPREKWRERGRQKSSVAATQRGGVRAPFRARGQDVESYRWQAVSRPSTFRRLGSSTAQRAIA